jgi:hypothetical protein
MRWTDYHGWWVDKELEGSGCGLFPEICLEKVENWSKPSVIAGSMAVIWMTHLQNTITTSVDHLGDGRSIIIAVVVVVTEILSIQ